MSIVLRTVGIIVKDMPKTLAFYRILGLNIPQESDTEENVDFEAEDGIVLGFVTEARVSQNDPKFVPPTSSSLNLQFECGSPAEVDETFARLTAARYAGYAEPWGHFLGIAVRKGCGPRQSHRQCLCSTCTRTEVKQRESFRMNDFTFCKKAFVYFDRARAHAGNWAWFEADRALYAEHVELPLTHLVMELKRELSPLLPGIDFSPRRIAKPPSSRSEGHRWTRCPR